MDLKEYYERALLLPIVLPIALLPLLIFVQVLPDAALLALALLLGGLVVGGLPYLVFLTFFYIVAERRTERQVQRAFRLAPLRFTSVMCLLVLLPAQVTGEPMANVMPLLWLFAGTTMGVGYFYVALAEAGRIVLRLRDRIREHHDLAGARPLPDAATPLPSVSA